MQSMELLLFGNFFRSTFISCIPGDGEGIPFAGSIIAVSTICISRDTEGSFYIFKFICSFDIKILCINLQFGF